MKKYLRLTLLNTFSLYVVSAFFGGLVTPDNLVELLYAGLIFTVINRLVKPIIKLFLLPINLITLGLFRWLANVLVLLAVTQIIDTVKIIGFISPSMNQAGFAIPSLNFNFPTALIIGSFLLSLTFNILNRLLTKE